MMFLQRQVLGGGMQGTAGAGILPFFPPQLANDNQDVEEDIQSDEGEMMEDSEEIESLADFPLDHL